MHEHWPKSAALLYQAPTNTRHGASGPIQTARPYANATHERSSWSPEPSLQHTTHPREQQTRRASARDVTSGGDNVTARCASGRRTDFRRFKRRLKRTGPRPDDEHGPRIRFELHVWAFVCIGSTVTTLRPDFRAPVARRVVGLRSQFRVEALVWPLSEGIRTRHCHLRHRVSPTEPGDRYESASLDIQTGGATM